MPAHHLDPLKTLIEPSSPLDSPPSLTYSEISDASEVTSTTVPRSFAIADKPNNYKDTVTAAMASTSLATHEQRLDASLVVQQVLGKLDNVVEHLRKQGENDAANEIAKNCIEMVQTFNQVTAPWDFTMFLMAPPPTRPRAGLANNNQGGQLRPAVASANSWAAVAATAVDKKKNGIIKFTPSDGLVKKYEPEAHPEDMRVVWIQGWQHNRPLNHITQYVTDGPICSMAYAPDHSAVCIVFQHASSAQSLVASSAMYQEDNGHSLFGKGCQAIIGQPYPKNDNIKRMEHPWYERRRLTFARSQLFAHGMTEQLFRDDIYGMVGPENVELVWLFNTGNATVVFTSSAIASLVRDNFLSQSASKDSPYYNVHVTFSHDPCEKPMNLITQIESPVTGRFRSDSHRSEHSYNGNGSGLHRSNSRAQGKLSRRESKRKAPKPDDDGWQTVTHKK